MPTEIRRWIFYIAGAIVTVAIVFVVRPKTESEDRSGSASVGASSDAATVAGQRQQLIGVRTARVSRESLGGTLRTVGTVQYDESRLTDVNLKLDGWIQELHVSYVGQEVSRGQSLFTLSSPDLLSAQTDLVSALKNREQALKASDGVEYNARLLEAPRLRMMRWDIAEDQIRAIEERQEVRPAIVFRSPASGVVIEKNVLKGMHIAAGQTLYRIADLSVVWIEVAFRELDLSSLRNGASAVVTTDAWPGEKLTGRIVHVYPFMLEQARTVKARIALENPQGRLKPGMFANVEVALSARDGLSVPGDAIVDSGTRQIAFVAKGNGVFEPREVKVGMRVEDKVLILSGLQEGDEVATRATFFLDSESQMRAALQSFQGDVPQSSVSGQSRFNIALTLNPSPPKHGKTVAEVRLRDESNRPVTDADVRLLFYMAPMPAMNMPAMRAQANLTHGEAGVYSGAADIPEKGRWDVTVTAARHGQAIAEQRSSVVVN